jgi:hypothetical protein
MELRRTQTIRILAALGGGIVVPAIVVGSPWVLGAGAAFVAAALVLNFAWGATSGARSGLCWFIGAPLWAVVGGAVPAGLVPAFGAGIVLLAVVLFVRELATVAFDEGGIRLRTLLPPRSIHFAWSDIETVTLDAMRVLVRIHSSSRVEDDARVILRAKGRSIRIDTTRYDGAHRHLGTILDSALPHAARWSLAEVQARGRVLLGPLQLTREAIQWRAVDARDTPWRTAFVWHVVLFFFTVYLWGVYHLVRYLVRLAKGTQSVPLSQARVTLEQGSVRIDGGRAPSFFSLEEVPNGALLPRLVEALAREVSPPATSPDHEVVV